MSKLRIEDTAILLTQTGAAPVAEVYQAVCVADVSLSLAGAYFTFHTPDNSYCVWYRVEDTNNDKHGNHPALLNHTHILVDINEDDTATAVATATETALAAATDVSVVRTTATLDITNDEIGAVTDIADGAIATGFTLAETTPGVTGTAAEVVEITCPADVSGSLEGTYFLIDSPRRKFYVWFTVAGSGTDPMVTGREGIVVDVTADDANTVVAGLVQAAIDAKVDFGASVATNVVTVTNAEGGKVADAVDVDSGATFNVTTSGESGVAFAVDVTDIEIGVAGSVINIVGGVASGHATFGIKNGDYIVVDDNFTGVVPTYTKDI